MSQSVVDKNELTYRKAVRAALRTLEQRILRLEKKVKTLAGTWSDMTTNSFKRFAGEGGVGDHPRHTHRVCLTPLPLFKTIHQFGIIEA